MKNWSTLEADIDMILGVHFTPGRAGSTISEIVLHHNAGDLSVQGCYDTWQSRKASAHYQVQSDGVIGQLVWDRDTAWHAGNGAANRRSIGIEHANSHSDPWTISDAALDNGAHLVAAICVAYKLGAPRWGVNVFPHKHYSATACPGEIAGSQREKYMARALYWYKQMTSGTATPDVKPAAPSGDIESLARAVIRGDYGNGADRKARLGAQYEAVQKRVNQILLGTPTSSKSIDELAREVIRGEWGNGQDRKNRLTNAGYSYSAVQARVNQILLG